MPRNGNGSALEATQTPGGACRGLSQRVAEHPSLLRALVERPDACGPGSSSGPLTSLGRSLHPLEHGLVLPGGPRVDIVFGDDGGGVWWTQVEDGPGDVDHFATLFAIAAALEAARPLTLRLLGLKSQPSHEVFVLVARRWSDAAIRAAAWITGLDVRLVTWSAALDTPLFDAGDTSDPIVEPVPEFDDAVSVGRRTWPPSPNGHHPDDAASEGLPLPLQDEAKRKILRIGADVVEEVDGDLVRFVVRDRVLSVLACQADQVSIYVGDRPDRRVAVETGSDLDRALGSVVQRYLQLSTGPHANGPRSNGASSSLDGPSVGA